MKKSNTGARAFGPKCANSHRVDLLTLSSTTPPVPPGPPEVLITDSALTLPGLFNLLFQIEIEQGAPDGEGGEDREGFSPNVNKRERESSEAPSHPSGLPMISPLLVVPFVTASFDVNPAGVPSTSMDGPIALNGVPIPDRDPIENSAAPVGPGQSAAALAAPLRPQVPVPPPILQAPSLAGSPLTPFGSPGSLAPEDGHRPPASPSLPAGQDGIDTPGISAASAGLSTTPAPVRFDLTPVRHERASVPAEPADSPENTPVDLPRFAASTDATGRDRPGTETSSGGPVRIAANITPDPDGGESPPRQQGDDSPSPAPSTVQLPVFTAGSLATEPSEAGASPSPPPERPAPMAQLAPEEPSRPAPARVSAFAIQVPGRDGAGVGLLVRSGGERIEMALSTADASLSRELRGQLPLLAANIERHGYELHPSTSAGFDQSGSAGGAGQRSRHREQRQQSPSRQKAGRRTNLTAGVSS